MKHTTTQILKMTAQYHNRKAVAEANQAAAQLDMLNKTGANQVLVSYASHIYATAVEALEANTRSENRARAKHLWV